MTATVLGLVGLLAAPSPGAAGQAPCGRLESRETLVPSYPPCFEVTLTADATGRPPLTYTWSLPDGTELTGNPLILDTGRLATGFSEILLTVSNEAGSDSFPKPFAVESLGFPQPPSFAVDGLTVHARANTSGATEWRWSWGDGSVTDWTTGCDGFAPTHTYAASGTYTVTVEARSCRETGALVNASVTVGSAPPPTIERFQAVCPTEPFCTFHVGEPVPFETVVSTTPDAYLYDWNGDGADDQVSTQPVESHTFQSSGYPIPRLTVLVDAFAETAYHPAPIEILSTGEPLFADDFESGDLRRWSLP